MNTEQRIDDVGGWPGLLTRLTNGEDLSRDEAQAALGTILDGDATSAQIAAFIVALRQKGESVDELSGLVQAMWAAAAPLELPTGVIDIVGAGGSPSRRRSALNVSTMASFVAASAGATVCKHGNRKASSTSGSFDLLELLGVNIEVDPAGLERCVAEAGIGFAFARTFHPAMRFAGPVRAELGMPTVFNILGPLSHPGRVQRQVIGISDPAVGDKMIRVLQNNGSTHAMVVSGDAALDEFSLTGPTRVLQLLDGSVTEYVVEPADVGLTNAAADDLRGGNAAANAAIARAIFAGDESGPRRDIVVLNAAAGLVVAGVAADLSAGVAAASEALSSGAAKATLDKLAAISNAT